MAKTKASPARHLVAHWNQDKRPPGDQFTVTLMHADRARDHGSGGRLTEWRRRQSFGDLMPVPAADAAHGRKGCPARA
jgi:hypothetical protein